MSGLAVHSVTQVLPEERKRRKELGLPELEATDLIKL
jgi:hypothetical protein